MNRLGLYTTPESGPTSWASVRRGMKDVSDADFRKQFSKLAFKNKGPGLLSKLKTIFTPKKKYMFRAPHEGPSRPGSITASVNASRPGFIAGLGALSPDAGAEILKESKSALLKMAMIIAVVGIGVFVYSRI